MVVVVGIALVVGTKYFFFGVALVAWMIVSTIIWPLLRGLYYVLVSPALSGHRRRAIVVVGAATAILIGAIAGLPIPHGTVVQGIVWIPEDARVVSEVAGQVVEFLREPGATVTAGSPILRLQDPYVAAKRAGAAARLAELRARLSVAETASPYETQLVRNQIAFAEDDLAETIRRETALVVRSPLDGALVVPRGHDLLGAFVKQGEILAFVMSGTAPVVRAAVPEDEIDLVRTQRHGVSVRLEGALLAPIAGAQVVREFPAATHDLPSRALAAANGGPFAIDPADKDQNRSLFPLFDVDIDVPSAVLRDHWGERVWIRFDHGAAPVIERWWRSARQVFLGRFRV